MHKILIEKKLTNTIDFSVGSNGRALIIMLAIAFCIIGIIFAIAIGKIGVAFTALSEAVFFGLLL